MGKGGSRRLQQDTVTNQMNLGSGLTQEVGKMGRFWVWLHRVSRQDLLMEVRQSRLGPDDRKNEVACAEFEQVILPPSFKVYLFFFGHSKELSKRHSVNEQMHTVSLPTFTFYNLYIMNTSVAGFFCSSLDF